MRIMDADRMTVEQFCMAVCQDREGIISCNGLETIRAWREGFSVRTTARQVIEDMLGIRVY